MACTLTALGWHSLVYFGYEFNTVLVVLSLQRVLSCLSLIRRLGFKHSGYGLATHFTLAEVLALALRLRKRKHFAPGIFRAAILYRMAGRVMDRQH